MAIHSAWFLSQFKIKLCRQILLAEYELTDVADVNLPHYFACILYLLYKQTANRLLIFCLLGCCSEKINDKL